MGFGAASADDFVSKLIAIAPALAPAGKDGKPLMADLKALASALDQLSILWSLVEATKDALFAREARLMGFGLAARSAPVPMTVRAGCSARSAAPYLKAGPPRPLRPIDPVVSPLMESEISAKLKWIRRLEAIAMRAGRHSLFYNDDSSRSALLLDTERDKLRKAVLAKGAFRTMAVHTRHFERFHQWSVDQQITFYPIVIDLVLKYVLWLDSRGCGPSVLCSLRAALYWIGSRLLIDMPDLSDARMLAVEKEIILARAKELKEAHPIPLLIVKFLELFVLDSAVWDPTAAIFAGWILCLIFGSLRFDDGVHVKPNALEFRDGTLYGVCWQTKVDRTRRGSKFVVPPIGFSQPAPGQESWLSTFVTLSARELPAARDFWMYEVDVASDHSLRFSRKVVTYPRALKVMRHLMRLAIDLAVKDVKDPLPPALAKRLLEDVDRVTMHSCKVTLINAAVHAGYDPVPISIQAHHANTDLVIKYTRNRTAVPLDMVSALTKEFRDKWSPGPGAGSALPIGDEGFSEDDFNADAPAMFFVKKSRARASISGLTKQKFHVSSDPLSLSTACRKYELADCEPVGLSLPDPALLCASCAKARPGVA